MNRMGNVLKFKILAEVHDGRPSLLVSINDMFPCHENAGERSMADGYGLANSQVAVSLCLGLAQAHRV